MVGIAGAPASGKSTLAAALCDELNDRLAYQAALVPMDGFHYDNLVLEQLGLLSRKGSPDTFDGEGFIAMLVRIRKADGDVIIPVFDRSIDMSRACAQIVNRQTRIIVVEGNYLLLDADPWRHCEALFDLTVFLEVPEQVLERRLVDRWLGCGFSPQAARQRAFVNDIPNARLVASNSLMADMIMAND